MHVTLNIYLIAFGPRFPTKIEEGKGREKDLTRVRPSLLIAILASVWAINTIGGKPNRVTVGVENLCAMSFASVICPPFDQAAAVFPISHCTKQKGYYE